MRWNYYKLRQFSLLQSAMDCYYKWRQLFHYKVRHGLLQIATGITKCDGFITNCDRYYKVRWLLQIATVQPHLDLGPFPCIFVLLVSLFIVCNFRFIQPGSTQSDLVHGTCPVGWRIVAGESRGNRDCMFFLFVAENILPIKSNCFEIRFTVLRGQLEYIF